MKKIVFYTIFNYYNYLIIFFCFINILAKLHDCIIKIRAQKFNFFIVVYLDNIFNIINNRNYIYFLV